MKSTITWLLTNSFTWAILLAIILGSCKPPAKMNRYSNTLRHIFLWYLGISMLWSGCMHLIFPTFSAAKIGWAPSPFQFEVGLSNLTLSALGIFAFFKPERYLWLVCIISSALFIFGAGLGHIYQIIAANDHSISNSGLTLYTDLFAPMIMLGCWFKGKTCMPTDNHQGFTTAAEQPN